MGVIRAKPVNLANIPFKQAKNYSNTNGRKIDLIIIHTMEYPERPTGAEWAMDFFASTEREASSHFNFDNNTVTGSVRVEDVAWAAPGANHNGIQFEHAGYAAQTSPNWDDEYSTDMLSLSASVAAQLCIKHNIPVRLVSVAGLKAGGRGITTHNNVSQAFKRSTHWDPGGNFPMNEYLAAVKAEVNRLTATFYFGLFNGEGDPLKIDGKPIVSAKFKPGDKEKERLVKFETYRAAQQLKELKDDGDVTIRRMRS